jgi:hypothetical protein
MRVYEWIYGFAGYGFCEAHAASFGDTAYKTAYMLRYYPAQFYAALLSCQPMGFYPPNTLALQARTRGIRLLLPDVNRSEIACTVEEGPHPSGVVSRAGNEPRGDGEPACSARRTTVPILRRPVSPHHPAQRYAGAIDSVRNLRYMASQPPPVADAASLRPGATARICGNLFSPDDLPPPSLTSGGLLRMGEVPL